MINDADIKDLIAKTGGVTIVAATKTIPPAAINALKDYGITRAGENRVQEFLEKYPLTEGIEWHFIGRLQTNKVKYIVDKVKMIQSVDRAELAQEINKQCEKYGIVMDILLQVNLGEEQKGGISLENLHDFAKLCSGLKCLNVKGLMCIPSIAAPKEDYAAVGKAFDAFKKDFDMQYLSMGMSADYELAIKHGANMIRPGSILFGERK